MRDQARHLSVVLRRSSACRLRSTAVVGAVYVEPSSSAESAAAVASAVRRVRSAVSSASVRSTFGVDSLMVEAMATMTDVDVDVKERRKSVWQE